MSEIHLFEVSASNMGRTANVSDSQPYVILDHDALPGTFNATTGDLEAARQLINGSTILLTLTIINAFNHECFRCVYY